MKTIWKLLVCFMLGLVVCGCEICGDQGEEYQRWDDGEIRYYLDSAIKENDNTFFTLESMIKMSMDIWMEKTNIKFIESESSGDYILHIKIGDEVRSSIGKKKKAYMIIKKDMDIITGYILQHELGHCVGLRHEHCRPDRDNYIEILWENIIDISEFQIERSNLYEVTKTEYDICSIMHYYSWMFAKDNKKSFIPLVSDCPDNKKITESDVEKVNAIYPVIR